MAQAKRTPDQQQRVRDVREEASAYIESIPWHTPQRIAEGIRAGGYIGQDRAVRAVSLMAYRHVSRLRKLHIDGVQRERLPGKTNMLFVGPTGCGKTFLVESLFRDLLGLPTVIVDMTSYSETGYVGQDVAAGLTRLLYAADFDPVKVSFGVVCLDEFDKIASGQNNAIFAGAGTTKDVSGLGVQRELLKILEGAELAVPLELSHSEYAQRALVTTRDIAYIGCGSFSGLKGLVESREEHIGFGRSPQSGVERSIAVSYTEEEVDLVRNFRDFGFLPELVGRFTRIVPFGALEAGELRLLLTSSVLERYQYEFSLEGKELVVSDEVLERIIQRSVQRETGARGLDSALVRYLEDAAFDAYSRPEVTRVELFVREDEILHELA